MECFVLTKEIIEKSTSRFVQAQFVSNTKFIWVCSKDKSGFLYDSKAKQLSKRLIFEETPSCSHAVSYLSNSLKIAVGLETGTILLITIALSALDLENKQTAIQQQDTPAGIEGNTSQLTLEKNSDSKVILTGGHLLRVTAVQVLPAEKKVISGSEDKLVIVWGFTASILRKLSIFKGPITNIFSTLKTPSLLKSRDFLDSTDLQSSLKTPFQKFEAPDAVGQRFGVPLVRRLPKDDTLGQINTNGQPKLNEEDKFDFLEVLGTAVLGEIMEKGLFNKEKSESGNNENGLKRIKHSDMDSEKEQMYKKQIQMLKKINNELIDVCMQLEK